MTQVKENVALEVLQASKLTIDTQEDLQSATILLHELKATLVKIEEEEAKVVAPLKEALKAEQARFSPFKVELKSAIEHIRGEQASYAESRAKVQEEAAKALQDGTATLEQAMDAYATSAVEGVTFRKGYKLKIVDASTIPRAYLLPNESLILETLKTGKKVKGCEIEETAIPVNRKSK